MALMKHKTIDLVQAIWTKWEGSTEEKMGLVHGLTMYVADIATLRPGEELNDQTMLCVSSPIISSFMLGKGHMGWSKKQDIRDYDVVIGCVNEKSCHWVTFKDHTLQVLDVQHRRCVVMDPPHKTKSLRLYSKHLNSFSKTMGYGEWQLSSSSDVPIQQDFTSCGIFCLKYLERYIRNTDTTAPLQVEDERLNIGVEIIQALQPLPKSCHQCHKGPFYMRRCNFCLRSGVCNLCSCASPLRKSELAKTVPSGVESTKKQSKPTGQHSTAKQACVKKRYLQKTEPSKDHSTEKEGAVENDNRDHSQERNSKKTLNNIQTSEIADWNAISSLDQLKASKPSPVDQSVRSNRSCSKMIHLISGDELIERTEAPEKMSLVELRDYLCIGKSSSGVHNCSGLKQIIDLIPKPCSNDTPVNPAWSLLTKGDVQYQIKSLSELTESLLDKESIKERVLDNMSGSRAQKETDIEIVKEIPQVIVQEVNKTDLNKAMHGEVFEAFCQILESMIPDKQTNQQT